MFDRLRRLSIALLDTVYPPACLLCHVPLPEGLRQYMLCEPCVAALTHEPHATCPRCCSTIGPGIDTSSGCVRCLEISFAYETAFRLGPYDGKLREAVLAMKHLTGESLAETMGLLWADHQRQRFQDMKIQAVVPIPLHFWRRCRRGYNQSAALARLLASRLGLPLRENWLARVRNTPDQIGESAATRRENVRDAFKVTSFARFSGLRVLLIDDVLTTGATANAAAKAVCEGGASRVDVAVLAHR